MVGEIGDGMVDDAVEDEGSCADDLVGDVEDDGLMQSAG